MTQGSLLVSLSQVSACCLLLCCRYDWAALCSCPDGDMVVVRSASELQLREAFKAVLTQVRNLVVLDDAAMGQLICRG